LQTLIGLIILISPKGDKKAMMSTINSRENRGLASILLILTFLLVYQKGSAQGRLPVLASDSTFVNIQIDGNKVATWYIDPGTKPWTDPDVFRIERSSKTRKVTYLSNRDSLSFVVKPGDRFDFVILIGKKDAFPMAVATFDEPVFQQKAILLTLFWGILILSILTYWKRKYLKTIPLLWLGIVCPSLFWIVTIIGGFVHGNYNHLHNVISELGAISTRSETFMSTTEIGISILCVLSIVGLYRACKRLGLNPIPVISILSLPVSMIWAAVFPMHHEMHGTLGPIPLLLNLGALLAVILWRGKEFYSLRIVSTISFIMMTLLFLRFSPNLRGNYEGLIQRFFYLGWSVWSVGLSLLFIGMLKRKKALY
jgi:hypothetical protein